MTQTVTEGNSFTVKDVTYDISSSGMKTAAHVRLERLYQGIQVLGGDSVVHINATDLSLIGISQTFDSQINIDSSYISEVYVQAAKLGHSVIVFDNAGVPTLAWDVIKTGIASDGTPMVVHYINDVQTGEKLFQYSDTKTFLNTGWPSIPLSNEREVHRNTEDFAALSLRKNITCSSSEAAVGIILRNTVARLTYIQAYPMVYINSRTQSAIVTLQQIIVATQAPIFLFHTILMMIITIYTMEATPVMEHCQKLLTIPGEILRLPM